MEETLIEKLEEAGAIIGTGMAVVFAALSILMVAILIINKLAPEKAKKAEGLAMVEAIESETSERERVAALAVAMVKAMERASGSVSGWGTANMTGLLSEPSRWALSGREQVMRSRGKAGRQWGRRSD